MSGLRRTTLSISALAITALIATGCGTSDSTDSAEGNVTIAAGFHPLAWVSERVAGDLAKVTSLAKPGQDAHDAELSIAARAAISDSDLVVINGGFQPSVDEAAEQSGTDVIDAAKVLDFRPVEDHSDHDHSDHSDHDDSHDDHADEGHSDEAGHEGHDHGGIDPHFWLDPILMGELATHIANELATIAPDSAAEFRANAAELNTELTALDADYTSRLSQCERSTVVVSHNAFGYLSRYGLEFEPIAGLAPGAEPTPAELARLQALIASEGITTVFNEVLAPEALAASLAKDAGVETAILDPIEGPTDTDSEADYITLMQANLDALTKANGC